MLLSPQLFYFILYSFLFRRAFPSLSGGGTRIQIPSKCSKKGKGKGKAVIMIQPKESWTHDFCLLSSTDQDKTPSQESLVALKEAELGRKKVVFPNKNGSFEHFKDVLESAYGKLKSQDGAFELMRAESGGTSRPLKIILMPSNGYTIPYLRDVVGSNTLLYIRPMKSSLSLDKPPQLVTNESPLTECPKCCLSIPIMQLRSHSFTCSGIKINDDSSDEKEFERSVFDDKVLPSASKSQLQNVKTPTSTSSTNNGQPGCSSGDSFIDEGIASLTSLFPDEGIENVREALVKYEDVDLAACALMTRDADANLNNEDMHEEKDVCDILRKLRSSNMESFLSAERFKVDEDDVVMDFLQYYKSPKFDPKIPITVRFRGQPGVDSGGLLRQAFTSVFEAIAQNKVPGLKLFTGQPTRLTPVYSGGNLLTQIFDTLGKMLAHSLVQDGPGFPYLAPAIYWYVATGDLNEGISRASAVDVVDEDLLMILDKVSTILSDKSL